MTFDIYQEPNFCCFFPDDLCQNISYKGEGEIVTKMT